MSFDLRLGYSMDFYRFRSLSARVLSGGVIPSAPFISEWKTDNAGTSNDVQVTLPLEATGDYDFNVDWGDGNDDDITAYDDAAVTHTYNSSGNYTVTITGTLEGWRFNDAGDEEKILNISSWGVLALLNTGNAFHGCVNLTCNAGDSPDLSSTTNLTGTFYGCTSLDGGVASWDVSNVENFSEAFRGCSTFNGDVDDWDVASTVNMSYLFRECSLFNRDLSGWDVSNTANFAATFRDCSVFNGSVDIWDTGAATDMYTMFYECSAFNQDIGEWNTANTTNMQSMFGRASVFNQDIGDWNTSKVTDMQAVFVLASAFNQDLSSWNTSNVTDMYRMFKDATVFNQDIGGWDTANTTNMASMLQSCPDFDQDLSSWNVEALTDASNMMQYDQLSTTNYTALLIAWAAQTVLSGVDFHAGSSQYGISAVAARASLVSDGWIITDGGMYAFITQWKTDNLISGSTDDDQIRIPLDNDGTYDFNVDWGDGTDDDITTYNDAALTHTYNSIGTYNVSITGQIEGFRSNNWTDREKLVNIENWGPFVISEDNVFSNCSLMTCNATDLPAINLRHSWRLAGAFMECTLFNGNLDGLDITGSTRLDDMFLNCTSYNQPMTGWDVSLAERANDMFNGCTAFNQDLSSWNLASVTDTLNMFQDCTSFNGNITTWNTPLTTNMSYMFDGCTVFNQDLSSWNTLNNTNMNFMFQDCPAFDQDLSSWNISSMTQATNFLNGSRLSTANYNALLIGWEAGPHQDNVNFHAGDSTYSAGDPTVARTTLNVNDGWIFADGGEEKFSATWNTEATGTTSDNQIKLGLHPSGTYNFNVNWGDGNDDDITEWDDAAKTHTYNSPGIYTVNITGQIEYWTMQTADAAKLLNVLNWGPLVIANSAAFYNCVNMTCNAPDVLNTANVTDADAMFKFCASFNWSGLGASNVSNMTLAASMFDGCTLFNQSLSNWDTSAMRNASHMFNDCLAFDQDLSWNTNCLENTHNMFENCTSFNGDISSWDMSKVHDTGNMLNGCEMFNQDIGSWNTANVTSMFSMLKDCYVFDQDLSSWNISSLTAATNFLRDAQISTANYDALLIGWEAGPHNDGVSFHAGSSTYSVGAATTARTTLNITDSWVFTDGGPAPFTTTWNTEETGTSNDQQITLGLSSGGTFNFHVTWGDGQSDDITAHDDAAKLHTYNSPGIYTVNITGQVDGWRSSIGGDQLKLTNISSWGPLHITTGTAFSTCSNMTCNAVDVFTVQNGGSVLASMFRNCTVFNGDLSALDLNGAQNIENMFENCAAYNQDMSSWDVSDVFLSDEVFKGCTALNQDLSNWNMEAATRTACMFRGCESFNGDVSTWDMPLTTNMSYMFEGCTLFNQDLSSWDTSNVINLNFLLQNCPAFDQDLSSWNISSLTQATNFLINGQLSTANYDALLIGWEAGPHNNNVSFHAGSSTYSAGAATTARTTLDDDDSWTFTDGGPA